MSRSIEARQLLVGIALCSTALLTLACAQPASPPLERRPNRPNIVLVVVDTLRADAVGFLGSPHGSPQLDRLANESVVFTDAIAPSTWTVPSVASLMTSLHPSELGLAAVGHAPRVLDDGYLTLAEVFRDAGYRTVGVVNQVFLTAKSGFGQGFDRYAAEAVSDARRVNDEVERQLASLDAAGDEPATPLFLYVHYFDSHWPYDVRTAEDRAALPVALTGADFEVDPPAIGDHAIRWLAGRGDETWRRQALDALRARYALEVRWIDGAIASLIDLLERRAIWGDSILVVTGDHGEAFWEHERLLHGHAAYEELIRVPLLVRTPAGLGFVPARRSAPVSLIDVMPTLLELADLPVPGHSRGRSLVAAMRGAEDFERALLVENGWERALRTRAGKLLLRRERVAAGAAAGVEAGASGQQRPRAVSDSDSGDGAALEYYDLLDDPGERRNLATPCAGACRESLRLLLDIERRLVPGAAARSSDVTPRELELLRNLGYAR